MSSRLHPYLSRSVSPLIMIVVAALVLAACARSSNDESSHTPEPPSTATAGAAQPLVLWHALAGTEAQAFDTIVAQFSEAYPSIGLEATAYPPDELFAAFTAAVDSAAGPDILIGPAAWIAPLAEQGALRSISTSLVQTAQNIIPPDTINVSMSGNSLFALPYSVDLPVIFYNKTLVSDAPRTFADLQELGSKYGLTITPDFLSTSVFYLSDANPLHDEQGLFTLSESALADYFQTLIELAATPGITFTRDDAAFRAQEIGFLIAPASRYEDLFAILEDDLGTGPMSRLHTIPTNYETIAIGFSPVMISINATAQAVSAADVFLAHLLSIESQTIWLEQSGAAPINAQALPEAHQGAWIHTLERAVSPAMEPAFEKTLRPALDAVIQQVLSQETSPQDAVQAIMTMLK